VFRPATILLMICICAACSPITTTPTAPPRPIPMSTLEASAVPATLIPRPSLSPTPAKKAYEYKVIYQDGKFEIREALLGTDAIWKADFQMPQARIENTSASLNLGRDMACDKQLDGNTSCSQTLEFPLANGGADEYTLRLDDPKGGAGVLFKNKRLVWSGYTNGGPAFAILSSRKMGNEIVFDYSKSNWGSNQKPLWMTPSILLTKGNAVVLISDAFAPNILDGNLLYFRRKTKSAILVFNGKEVGASYSEVFNQLCCWGGPPIEIASNGQIIDFFAQKGRDWYHVQAGYFEAAK
jgi:hypothetical protein